MHSLQKGELYEGVFRILQENLISMYNKVEILKWTLKSFEQHVFLYLLNS